MDANNIHIALIQETKLLNRHKTPTIKNYTAVRKDRNRHGGGLITYIHKTIRYTDTTTHTDTLIAPDNTTELQSFRISTGHTQYMNIINIYIPPDTSPTVPSNYIPHLHNLATLPYTLIAGDFNAKDSAWYTHNQSNIRGQHINTQLHNMFILNNTDKYTHIPHQALYNTSSPDITLCSPSLAQNTSWRVEHTLPSDHLPIIITTRTRLRHSNTRTTHTNYKKADWNNFKDETETHFLTLNSFPICNIDTTIKQFNNIINNADRKHIPRGNRKHYNPNFTPEIDSLIKQRNIHKFRSPLPHTHDTTTRIQLLNNEINSKIRTEKTNN